MHSNLSRNLRALAAATACSALALPIAGCHKQVTDAQLTSDVQAALKRDNAISSQPIQVAVQNGVVTLTGNVTDDTASTVAAQDAAKVKGTKEVIDQLNVAGVAVVPTVTSPDAPAQQRQTTPEEQQTIAKTHTLPPPAASTTRSTASTAAPVPAAPTYHDVTAPAGTVIPVRITEALSSDHSEDGQSFNGTVTSSVTHDGYTIIPAGAAVSGRVLDAKDAGRFKGHSALSIALTSVRRNDSTVQIATDAYTLEGKNRGKNSFEKVGGGAAIGAVLGGIFGGGKGAGIGALAGGGGGAALQGFTHGQQVRIPSESVVRFRLSQAFTVRTTVSASEDDSTTLHHR